MKLCVGLFGTCGGSKWRDKFMECYKELGIPFFNPFKDDWSPEDAIVESEHLNSDKILLFPVLSGTYGTASLAEIGMGVANMLLDEKRQLVVYVVPEVDEGLKNNALAAKESNNARKIVLAHLNKLKNNVPNLHVVNSLDEMLEVSCNLFT